MHVSERRETLLDVGTHCQMSGRVAERWDALPNVWTRCRTSEMVPNVEVLFSDDDAMFNADIQYIPKFKRLNDENRKTMTQKDSIRNG